PRNKNICCHCIIAVRCFHAVGLPYIYNLAFLCFQYNQSNFRLLVAHYGLSVFHYNGGCYYPTCFVNIAAKRVSPCYQKATLNYFGFHWWSRCSCNEAPVIIVCIYFFNTFLRKPLVPPCTCTSHHNRPCSNSI